MDQPRRSVTTLAEAVDNVRKTCEQYRLAVDKALIMTEWFKRINTPHFE